MSFGKPALRQKKWVAWLLAGWLCLSGAAAWGEDAKTGDEPSSTSSASSAESALSDEVSAKGAGLTPLGDESSQNAAQVPDDQKVPVASAGLNERVSLDLRNIEVADALRFLAQKGGLNLVLSKKVSGRVQLLLNNVPVKDILDIILNTAELASEQHGDIFYVMTEDEYKTRYGRKFSDTRRVRMFRLKYAVPEQAFALFEVLKSEIGRLLVDPESGTVLVMDTQDNIDRMEKALEGLEQKRSIKVYSLKYAKAVDVEARLKSQLDAKKVGLISADERTNQVIVETLPNRMKDIDELVEQLDQKTREVLIDARIIKVTMSDDLNAEIKWEGLFSQLSQYGTSYIGNHPFSPLFRTGESFVDDFAKIAVTTRPTAGSKSVLTQNLVFGTVGEDSYEVLINFLKTLGETKVLSNPKIAVVNNQEAKIHVGQKQAYVTTTTTTGQNTSTTAESVTFIDVGIQLAVTPVINEDGFVTMKIKPEVSDVVDFLDTPSGNKIPIVDSSTAETAVMVKDGVSIIIGGLRKDNKTETHKRIPFLGDIPIIGAPFNSTVKTKDHTELIILLTPHIVYGDKVVNGDNLPPDQNEPHMPYADYEASSEPDAIDYGPLPDLDIHDIKNKEPLKGAGVRS